MVGLPDGEKKFEDMCNRLGTIPACDRQTDGQTDILPRHSPRYTYASRGKNEKLHWTDCSVENFIGASDASLFTSWSP